VDLKTEECSGFKDLKETHNTSVAELKKLQEELSTIKSNLEKSEQANEESESKVQSLE